MADSIVTEAGAPLYGIPKVATRQQRNAAAAYENILHRVDSSLGCAPFSISCVTILHLHPFRPWIFSASFVHASHHKYRVFLRNRQKFTGPWKENNTHGTMRLFLTSASARTEGRWRIASATTSASTSFFKTSHSSSSHSSTTPAYFGIAHICC